MINSKKELDFYLLQDARANGRSSTKARFWGDEIWKYQRSLRKLEYYTNKGFLIPKIFWRFRFHHLSVRLGFQIPINVCREGLPLPHYGSIIIGQHASIGKFCRIHEGVTIGATNGSDNCATIGDNVFIASGAKIIGDVFVASDCAIAANAVVVKDITVPGTTWGGVPAVKISDNNSHSNLRLYKKEETNDLGGK